MTKEQFNYILDRIDQTISQDQFLNNNYEMLCAFANCFYWTFASDDFLENVLVSKNFLHHTFKIQNA